MSDETGTITQIALNFPFADGITEADYIRLVNEAAERAASNDRAAAEYRDLAGHIWQQVQDMGEETARVRSYLDKPAENSYSWYLRHFTEMAEFLEQKKASRENAAEKRRQDIDAHIEALVEERLAAKLAH